MGIYRMRTEFGKHLRVILIVIAGVFVVGAIWQFGAAPRGMRGQQGVKNEIAVVNGMPISQQEFDVVWDQVSKEMSRQAVAAGTGSTLELANLRQNIFQQFVQTRMLLSTAEQMGIKINQKAVKAELDNQIRKYLEENRRAVLGSDLSDKQAKIDPREDRQYKQELARNGMSLAGQEEIARSLVTESQVRAQLTIEALQATIKKKADKVTDKDIKDSYNVYKGRQIFLALGKLPDEQMKARAKKILKEAKAGADFAKLARENSEGPYKDKGGEMEYSLEMSLMTPPEVAKAIEKMKPGQISGAIDTDRGIYIVKLESVTPKLPEKLDKKTKDQRRQMIRQMREMAAFQELDKQMREKAVVKINDPEMRGYWHIAEAQRSKANQTEYRKQMGLAASSLLTAIKQDRSNYYATAKLAQVYKELGKTEEAKRLLYQLLDSESSTARGADLNLMLGDLLAQGDKPEDKEAAIEQYKKASDAAVTERNIHDQLVMRYQQLGQPDLVAHEQDWIANYEKQLAEYQARQKELTEKENSKTAESPKSAPKPKAGG